MEKTKIKTKTFVNLLTFLTCTFLFFISAFAQNLNGRGYYGRLLGTITVNGMDFGLEMIRKGYACVYWKSAPPEYIRAMRQAEKERKGLWGINYSLMKCLCR